MIRDLNALEEIEVEQEGKRFLLRTEARGGCSAAFRAAGVGLPQTVRSGTAPPNGSTTVEVEEVECGANGKVRPRN